MSSCYNETFSVIAAMNKAMHNEEYRCDYLDHGLLLISLQLVIADANRWKFARYAKNKGVLIELALHSGAKLGANQDEFGDAI